MSFGTGLMAISVYYRAENTVKKMMLLSKTFFIKVVESLDCAVEY